jgi:FkbM family methyltransferase
VRGDYEVPERRAVSQLLREGDRVLEIGTCIGLVAMTAAKVVGGRNVLSFEPNPAAAKVAQENFALNNLPIELVNAALGDRDGTLDLRVGDSSWLGASAHRQFEGPTIATPMRSIADVVGGFKPSVLVVDAEGMEEELLTACPFDNVRALIVEVHPEVIGTEGVTRIGTHLRACGFAPLAALCSGDTQTWVRPGAAA